MMKQVNKHKIQYFSYVISFVLLVLIVIKVCNIKDSKNKKIEVLSDTSTFSSDGDIIFGDKSASIQIYLFANYKCPFCLKFFKEVLPEMLKEYEGEIKINFKPIPFSNSKEELDALLMAISVFKYGDYMPFHDLLLKDPDIIYSNLYKDYLIEIMNLNHAIATSFLDDKTVHYIQNNKKLFKDLKLKGTPAFIVKNKAVSGYLTFDEIKKMIDN